METNRSAHPARRVLVGRIEHLVIGPADAAFGFERRLATENGWTEAFAERVSAEYRRFLMLVASDEALLTPSDAVDQAWHLHMVYTRDYWHGLCRDILGRELHHEPTEGGAEQRERYRARYADTLERYRKTFGTTPPADIWPDPSIRFAGRFQRVNLHRSAKVDVEWIGATLIGSVGLAVAAMRGMTWLVVPALLIVAILTLVELAKMHPRWSGRLGQIESDGSGFDGIDGCGGGDGGCGGGCGGGCS